MRPHRFVSPSSSALGALASLAAGALAVAALAAPSPGDWPEWRGPARDGHSSETGLPESWSPDGENLLWKAPFGGRSTPVVLGRRVYLQNAAGDGAERQERVLCLDADTGAPIWEHRFPVYHSDVPPHRVGWASPAVDPATGRVYAFGVGGTLLALEPDGRVVWERSLTEDFGLITTHGGRTPSPVLENDLVIVSGLSSGWGEQAMGRHRFFAFDKATGETVWVATPGKRPYDTTYSPPVAIDVDGMRLLLVGGGDGAMHALQPLTGASRWRFEYSKRGINTGAAVKGTVAVVSHGEENLDTSTMGLLAAIDVRAKGEIPLERALWRVPGFLGGYSSPVLDGDRVLQIDNAANLTAFDVATGELLWRHKLGTIQRASPVVADGKVYVGSENGKFYILRTRRDGCDVLDEDQLGTEEEPEPVTASVAVAHGRVYVVSRAAVYCIGREGAPRPSAAPEPATTPGVPPPGEGPPAHLQVRPTELVLAPGETVRFAARLFDERGRPLPEPEAGSVSWTLDGVEGELVEPGLVRIAATSGAATGRIEARLGTLAGAARLRVVPPLPWSYDFETGEGPPDHWIGARGKFETREVEGRRVLVKKADNPFLKRARVVFGPSDAHDYTVEAEVLSTETRRRMGDAGVVAQRYALVLFGNHQRLELFSWQPETERTVRVPFSWAPDTWYRVKLRVENLDDGTVLARGKAWPAAEPEPDAWTVEKRDRLDHRRGSAGLYADAHAEVFFDNVKVEANR